ncbi:MAG: efflux RND transporter periplasmic adaptor subunit [Candidatus Paceibacterota bacterium]
MKVLLLIKKPMVWIPLLILLALIGWSVINEEELNIDVEEVSKRDVFEEVSGTARVAADEEIDLSFDVSGTVEEVLISEGEDVEQGQTLARLDTDLIETEVQKAEADLKAAQASLEEMQAGLTSESRDAAESKLRSAETALHNAEENMVDVEENYDQQVEDAKETLLTTDLQARLTSEERPTSYSYEPPSISGTFTGLEEGEYRITLYRSNADSGYSFRYETDLESDGTGKVSTIIPQPLGKQGLYILFPSNFARHWGVEWTVEIPNKDSVKYPELKQAFESAKENRDRAVREAERKLKEADRNYEVARSEFEATTQETRSEKIKAQEAQVEQAKAALQAANVNLQKSTLQAPVSGVVHTKHISVGENTSPGNPVFSLATEEKRHLKIWIPEVDVANLSVGDQAQVSLDAFPREEFTAKVVNISKVAVDREGVATFKTRLDFDDLDERIRVGMNADLDILTEERENVLAVPGRAVIQRNGDTYVRVIEDEVLEYREVERGLRGSDGWMEILSGLKEGEKVVTYAEDSDLEKLPVKED